MQAFVFSRSIPSSSVAALFAVAALGAGCGNDGPPPAVAARWALICPNSAPNCQQGLNNVVNGFDGERGAEVSCSGSSSNEDLVNLAFSAGQEGQSYELEVRRALINRTGGASAGRGCEVVIQQSGNEYVGDCSTSPPTEETPCQLFFPPEADDGEGSPNLQDGVVFVQILCVDIPQRVSRQSRATVLDVDTTFVPNNPIASEIGAPFLFNFCDGV